MDNLCKVLIFLFLIADKLAEIPGFFVRIIPTAKSLFNTAKLDLKRNNVRVLNQGRI
jgi:U3 small nucleolar RNA-associated protein 22